MPNRAVGPVPPQSFLDLFLPQNRPSRRRIRKDIFVDVRPDKYNDDDAISHSFVSRFLCNSL